MGDGCPPAIDDETLVARAIAGDTAAFDALVGRYRGRVRALAYRQLGDPDAVEEALQETFFRAFAHLGDCRPGSRFGAWLCAIATHWCIDHRRRQGRRRESFPLSAIGEAVADGPTGDDPAEAVHLAEQNRAVGRWIGALPFAYRQVVILRYFEDLSYAEISSRLGQPITTVKIRLYRARQRLARSGYPDEAR